MIPFYKSSSFNVIIGGILLSNILLKKQYLEDDKKTKFSRCKTEGNLGNISSIIHIKKWRNQDAGIP